MERVAVSPAERAAIVRNAGELERLVRGPVALAVARRWAQWRSLNAAAAAAQLTPDQIGALVGAELLAAHERCDGNARQLAELVRGLNSGALELVPWRQADALSHLRFAVVRSGGLGWVVLPFVIVGAVVVGGAWLLADLYLDARKLEAEADQVRAQTASRITAAVTQLSATDPAAAAQLAAALTRANQAANGATPGLLDRLASFAGDAASSSGGLLVIAALWFLFGRGRRAAA